MSTVTEHTDHVEHADHDAAHDEHEGHFSDRQYVLVAIFLAALTAIEVSTYYVDFGPLFMPTLFALMIIKFLVVVSFFMHLKFDNKLFSWMFYSGLVLAIAVYVGALATFQFFLS
jgi:cytochrome c oxidase subunit IV